LTIEAIAASLAAVLIVVFVVLTIGIAPFLSEQQGGAGGIGAARTSVKGHLLPTEEGSVQFEGTVRIRGELATQKRVVFLFDQGFISKDIVTDSAGRFRFRLPPGHWTLLSPYIADEPSDVRFEINPPLQKQRVEFVVDKGPVQQTYTLDIFAN
jgi:hypothetical protein